MSRLVVSEERGEGVLVLQIDTGLQSAAPEGRKGDRLIAALVPLGQQDAQRVVDDVAESAVRACCDVLGLLQQRVVDVHRRSHVCIISSGVCIMMQSR
jgi:hypothetical protein